MNNAPEVDAMLDAADLALTGRDVARVARLCARAHRCIDTSSPNQA